MIPADRQMVGWTVRHSVAMVALVGGYLDHSESCKKAGSPWPAGEPAGCKACLFDAQVDGAIQIHDASDGQIPIPEHCKGPTCEGIASIPCECGCKGCADARTSIQR